MKSYDHKSIEKKWRDKWKEEDLYKVENKVEGKKNFYTLVEFPYPSGNLHVGHWYAFAVTDIFARYMKMIGNNVLFPIGFDAFGLPAENAAIKRGLNPRNWTYENIEFMKNQIASMGACFDWSREVITCDPEYYKWTQWFFTKFVENDLAYQAETIVNWCPSCKTVLANEQVVNGKCERCSSDIEHKKMNQWMIRITKYADRLVNDLDNLNWPHAIKQSQREWIGKSEGTFVSFEIENSDEKIKVFTTRIDTIFGVTFMVIAPEHDLINKLQIKNIDEVREYVKESQKKTELVRLEEKDKTGIVLEGIYALNPANGIRIPVFIADYVLNSYGTGAIMAVPAHDERDREFAEKYDLPIISICDGDILINSDQFNGLKKDEAIQRIIEEFNAEKTTNYRLRDWGVSRQRYWGCPIPIIHCNRCGAVPVPEKDLPVILPEIDDYLPRDDGKSPLAKVSEWVNVDCPKCGEKAERETDTLDTFMDSSWYFLRYVDPKNKDKFADEDKISNWMPVDFYSGGAEHTTMHLLYSRFFQKALFDLGLIKDKEPFKERLNRGLILGPDGNKMSKSKGNVIDPDDIVIKLGADTVRAYLAFIGPYNEVGSYPWDPNGVVGIKRFLERIYNIKEEHIVEESTKSITTLLHKTIKKVTEDISILKFNTAISSLMILTNLIEKEGISNTDFKILLKILSPIAPFITEEIWNLLGENKSIHLESWPQYDKSKTIDLNIKIAIQVNGKLRSEIEIQSNTEEKIVKEMATKDETIKKWIEGKEIRNIIYVKDKLVNIVL